MGRTNVFRANDLKVSTTAVRLYLFTAILISDIGAASAISQATTNATLCLTAEAGRMERPDNLCRRYSTAVAIVNPNDAFVLGVTRFGSDGA